MYTEFFMNTNRTEESCQINVCLMVVLVIEVAAMKQDGRCLETLLVLAQCVQCEVVDVF